MVGVLCLCAHFVHGAHCVVFSAAGTVSNLCGIASKPAQSESCNTFSCSTPDLMSEAVRTQILYDFSSYLNDAKLIDSTSASFLQEVANALNTTVKRSVAPCQYCFPLARSLCVTLFPCVSVLSRTGSSS
jgi:hypothetical protein